MLVAKATPKNQKRVGKVRVAGTSALARFFLGPFGRALVIGIACLVILGVGVFTYFYAKYARVFDEKLKAGLFANSAKIFAAPDSVAVGETLSPAEIAAQLRRSGYTESRSNPVGYYEIQPN